jgi:O-glycosyl hydrolase
VSIDPSAARQTIDGFGGSNAWTGLPSDAAARAKVLDLLFSTTKGAGLSILRNRIPFRERPDLDDRFLNKDASGNYLSTTSGGSKTFSLNWSTWDLQGTKALVSAIQAGGSDYQVATILSTPWTPPNNAVSRWKTGVADAAKAPEIGGSLDPAHYKDYADVLADYALGFQAAVGMPLGAISVQNEPNWLPQYESCSWTEAQFAAFLPVLRAEFAAKGVPSTVKVVAPEDMNFKEDLLDDATLARVDVVGVHQYDARSKANHAAQPLPRTRSAGKRLWMTEWSTEDGGKLDASITDALLLAHVIHDDLTIAEVNAFLYWWLWNNDTTTLSNGALLATSGATVLESKRLHALGQYSRFVRPGWTRVAATASPVAGVFVTAFVDPSASRIAVVAVNEATADARLSLDLSGKRLGTLATYRTSASESLAAVGSVAVNAASASVTAKASTVTTWTGDLLP